MKGRNRHAVRADGEIAKGAIDRGIEGSTCGCDRDIARAIDGQHRLYRDISYFSSRRAVADGIVGLLTYHERLSVASSLRVFTMLYLNELQE